MKIFILEQNYEADQFAVDGLSGTVYPFLWNKANGRYEYTPASQDEVDDIFRTQNINSLFFYSAAFGEAGSDKGPRGIPAPAVPRQYYADLDEDELRALAKDAGIATQPKDDKALLLRLIEAYYFGAGYRKAHGDPKSAQLEPHAPDVPAASSDAEQLDLAPDSESQTDATPARAQRAARQPRRKTQPKAEVPVESPAEPAEVAP